MTKININFQDFLKNIILKDKTLKKFYLRPLTNTKYTIDDILSGILFILKTGISWRDTPSIVK